MFFMEDIRSYEENNDPTLEELGNVLSVFTYNGEGINILSTFAEFKKKHDAFIDYQESRTGLINTSKQNN